MKESPRGPLFTVSQVAQALGIRRQSVGKRLSNVTPDAEIMVSGNLAPAWHLPSLPERIRAELTAVANSKGYRTPAELLGNPPDRWEPKVPFSKVAPVHQEKARKLQEALRPVLNLRHDMRLSAAELEERGILEYRRVFGHEVSHRHFRKLLSRTLERDKGEENWDRPDLYLEEGLLEYSKPPLPENTDYLEPLISDIRKLPEKPSLNQKACLWGQIFEIYRDRVVDGADPVGARRRILEVLLKHAPFMGKGMDALRRSWKRKYETWRAAGGALAGLKDRRKGRAGRSAVYHPTDGDVRLLAFEAGNRCGARLSQAHRKLYRERAFSDDYLRALDANPPTSKSWIPLVMRERAALAAKAVEADKIGRKAQVDEEAFHSRDFSNLAPMECLQADDVTLPVYFWIDGPEWPELVRGQFLVMIDVRSKMILGYSLQPDPGYNSFVIRSLMNRVCLAHGIPKVFYFERGMWAKAQLIKGNEIGRRLSRECVSSPFSFDDCQVGFSEFGCQFKHATTARAKPVERVNGLLQDFMEGEPGYCGRNERKDCPAELEKLKYQVQKRQVHPEGMVYSYIQWYKRLEQIVREYNAEVQQGEWLQNESPGEVFLNHWPVDNPPIHFDEELAFLLANHRMNKKVTKNGITFKIGSETYNYKGASISHLTHQQVLCWFDIENPESLIVTDLDRKNPVRVERYNKVGFLEADREHFAREDSKVKGQSAYPRAMVNAIKADPRIQERRRKTLVSDDTAKLGSDFKRIKEEDKEARRTSANLRRKGRSVGVLTPSSPRDPEEVNEGLDVARRALEKLKRKEQAANE